MSPRLERLNVIVRALPDRPGVYRFYNSSEEIIYVGKAKSLKKRVSSYFNKESSHSGKVRVLVSHIHDIRTTVVDTEMDALLLENNLIKKYQPRYNIQLKDDKTFPWICIRKEPFPRVFATRNPVKDGSEYFGPFASVKMMNMLLDLMRQLYPLRTCRHHLSPQHIERGKFSVCLQYHIKNCLGPCEGLQSEEDYNQSIAHIRSVIKGNIGEVIRKMKQMMKAYAAKMEFENAQAVKEKLELLESYKSKSTIVSTTIHNVDVLSIQTDDKLGYVNFLKVVDGAIVQTHTIEMKKRLEESKEELLAFAIAALRSRFNSNATELVVPFVPETVIPGVKYTVPKRGDKKSLLELSDRNVRFYRLEKQKRHDLVDPERHTRRVMETMKRDLRLKEEPRHIECFDNSNFQGDYPVAAMVCFKHGKPSKSDYRHYNVKTVEGPDDFASMEEIIFRRYDYLQREGLPMPQLILVDGGKGQLSAALKSLEKLGLRGKIAILGIAKRLEELYFPGDSLPLYLDKKSETLKVLQRLRDEAHRFGITHHRKRRDKGTLKSALTDIPSIGVASATLLLKEFHSLKRIKEASEPELAAVVGKVRARAIVTYFSES
ncbi:MAG: excinuclease ABC subunit C [Bacteroidetes bacterium]|nr:MAG: excinuclease ABC subunit C [Bacteroidota bacterium]PIE88372.1 MAG: excinuclease ABC subunit C [Bacteroidota bacterium]